MSRVRDLASILTASSVLGTDVEVATAVSNHSAASNPHTEYVQKTLTTTTGDIIYASSANTPARLGIGSTSQVLSVSGGVPAWTTPSVATPTFVGCSIYQGGAGQTPANATSTLLTFDSEFFDTNGFHETTGGNTGRVTIPTGYGGKYLVNFGTRWVANSTGYRNMEIYKNGTSLVQLFDFMGGSTGTQYGARSIILNLVAGDYLTFYVYQNSGNALTLYVREYEMPVQVQWLGA